MKGSSRHRVASTVPKTGIRKSTMVTMLTRLYFCKIILSDNAVDDSNIL